MDNPSTLYADDVEVQKFLSFLHEEQTNFAGESKTGSNIYTPRTVVSRYFADGRGSLEELLKAVLKEEEHVVPATETIHEQYLTVLTILLGIGQAHYLNRFIERDYSDERLPFFDRPRHFPQAVNGPFFNAFFDAQFRFCPIRFSKNPVNLQIEPEQILPLRGKQQIKVAGPAVCYKVELHEDYDTFKEDSGAFQIDLIAPSPAAHTYVFKEFHGKASRSAYDKELTAFLTFSKTSQLLGRTIVGFYGSFIQDNTYTIILEYADRGTFNDYTGSVQPPLNGEDITRLWESLLKLHEALHAIHNISAAYSQDIKQYSALRGWHQYLKPENIGVVSVHSGSEYDCQFRIMDLGIPQDATDVEVLSTRMYMAPECSQGSAQVNMQMADIWSLGCIYSEFAVWATFGSAGLQNYRTSRADEGRERAVGSDIGAFHDGHNLLHSVRAYNNQVVDNKNPDDRVTEPVLQQMVEEMLYEDGDARPSTRQLKMKINKILTRAREKHLADLRRFDSLASSNASYSSMGLSTRSHLSPHISIKSQRSGSSDSGVGYGIALTERVGRSGTGRSSNAYRESGHPSPSAIDEESETVSNAGSLPMSPASPNDVQRPFAAPSNRNTSYSFVPDVRSNGPLAPLPVRQSNYEQVSDVQSLYSNSISVVDAALMNGEDKEIAVTRGPPPTNLRRPTSNGNQDAVYSQSRPPSASASQSPQASPYGASPFTVQRRPLAAVVPDDTPPVPPIPSLHVVQPFQDFQGFNTRAPPVRASTLPYPTPNANSNIPSASPPPAYTYFEDGSRISLNPRIDQDAQRNTTSPAQATLALNSLVSTISDGSSSAGTSIDIRPDIDLHRSISMPTGSQDRPATAASSSTGIAPSERSVSRIVPRGSSITTYKPSLDLIDGLIWLNQKKGAASNATLRDESYLNTLADRDFIFLVDDARSMRAHLEMTSRAVRLLSWLLKKHDKNGMDLYFMNKPGKTHARPGHSSDLQRPLLSQLGNAFGTSNVASRLVEILQDFRQRNAAGSGAAQTSGRSSLVSFRGNSSKNVTGAKKIMIYVLTDGIWERNTETTLRGTMEQLGGTLLSQGAPDNAVGIQFIRTVEDPEIIAKMGSLVGRYSDRISVDTEFLEGNIFRLLLGPATDLWDEEKALLQQQAQERGQV